MTDVVALLAAAWRDAAVDLGIEVVAPYSLTRPEYPRLEFPALVKRFGRPHGTVVDVFSNQIGSGQLGESLLQDGYFYSLINPDVYVPYERDAFVETLVDWGWFDSQLNPPDWYSDAVRKSRSA
ncbi:hypothetical protein Pla52o_34260 [Novipirellula galeiformis]|uniref:Uncharacterized protein n=1 Tax=Novipirellula galeiformis TaxID=2528004 RepID=A0A5C6CCP7_9BACT|nr:hypothetical protein [Novipirellula galeiformis]TWU22370.1 hypothetical protein Pla52o_34260 [Novipirellula galeiformis]